MRVVILFDLNVRDTVYVIYIPHAFTYLLFLTRLSGWIAWNAVFQASVTHFILTYKHLISLFACYVVKILQEWIFSFYLYLLLGTTSFRTSSAIRSLLGEPQTGSTFASKVQHSCAAILCHVVHVYLILFLHVRKKLLFLYSIAVYYFSVAIFRTIEWKHCSCSLIFVRFLLLSLFVYLPFHSHLCYYDFLLLRLIILPLFGDIFSFIYSYPFSADRY